MSAFKKIRERLQMTQAAIGAELGVTQGNVSFYEKGQTVPPDAARKLIELARSKGLELTFDHVYGGCDLPEQAAVDRAAAQPSEVRDAA